MQAIEGIKLSKQGNGNWYLLIPRTLTYDEFESCMQQFLSSPTAPTEVLVNGEKWDYANLTNKAARMMLWQSL